MLKVSREAPEVAMRLLGKCRAGAMVKYLRGGETLDVRNSC